MKSTAVVPTPVPDAEALIKEARRRQRRRYAGSRRRPERPDGCRPTEVTGPGLSVR